MKLDTEQLINELQALTQTNSTEVKSFEELSDDQLNFKPNADSWSVLECIEHLNRYGNFYLPEIEKQILGSTHGGPMKFFKPGILGNYFVRIIRYNEKGIKKMQAKKEMNAANSKLDRRTLDQFVKQQQKMLTLLEQSRKMNLTRIRTAISISNFVKLRLGDTLRFMAYHNERHVIQAQRVIKLAKGDQ